MGSGRQKFQLVKLKCIHSIPILFELHGITVYVHPFSSYISYFEAAKAACPLLRWGAEMAAQASHADWDWENWKDPNAGWGGPNAGDCDLAVLAVTHGMDTAWP